MVMHDTWQRLHQMRPYVTQQGLSRRELGVLVETLSDGVSHPLPIVIHGALGAFDEGLEHGTFHDMETNLWPYTRLLTATVERAHNPPSHPRFNIGEAASRCISRIPPEVQEHFEVERLPRLGELVLEVVKEGYKTDYEPEIFYAKDEDEFKIELEKHNETAEEQVHNKTLEGQVYDHKEASTRGCFYSNVLEAYVLHPKVNQVFEKDTKPDPSMMLKYFENILHEVTSTLIDYVQGDEEILSPTLKEYVIPLSARQITVDYADEIIGRKISQSLRDAYVKNNKVIFNLLPPQKARMRKIFSKNGGTDEQIARSFISKLSSREGLKRIAFL